MRIVPMAVHTQKPNVTLHGSRRLGNVAVALTMLVCGCGDSVPVSIPAPTTPTPPPPTTVTSTLFGFVYDTVSRSVPSAMVEVVDGPAAGLNATTDERGHLSMNGTFAVGANTVRVSKGGYETATTRMTVPSNPSPTFTFTLTLRSLDTPLDLSGNYTLTFKADDACGSNLPPGLQTRSYTATIAPLISVVDGFGVTLAESSLISRDPLFLRVSGDYVYMPIDPEFSGGVTERVGRDAYVQLLGTARGTAGRSRTWSIPFDGSFDYCEVPPTERSTFLCGLSNPTRRSCSSKQNEVVFAKR